MASEHAQLSAKAAAGSRFAVTYGLLRQYMKEQGGSGATRCLAPAVGVAGLMPEADAAAAAAEATEERTTVLELFPQQAGTLKDEQQRCVNSPLPSVSASPCACELLIGSLRRPLRKRKERADGRAPLTIFYGGKMVVFDDFPAEKAEELMQLAGSGNAAQDALGQPSLTGTNANDLTHIRTLSRLQSSHGQPAEAHVVASSRSYSGGDNDSIHLSRARFFRHAPREEGVAKEVPGEEEEPAHRGRSVPGSGGGGGGGKRVVD